MINTIDHLPNKLLGLNLFLSYLGMVLKVYKYFYLYVKNKFIYSINS